MVDRGQSATERLQVWEQVLEALPAAVIAVDAECRPQWANRTARVIAGCDDPLDAARRLLDVPPPQPGDRAPSLADVCAAAVTGDDGRAANVRLGTSTGVIQRDLWAATVPGPGGAPQGAVVLISAEEERLQALLEHTADVITVLEPDGTIRYSNPAAGQVTGYRGRVMAGTNAFDLVHPDDRDEAIRLFAAALEHRGTTGPVELRVRHGDGSWRDMAAYVNNLVDHPAVGGIVVTLHDVTDRKAAEEHLARSEAHLRALVENLSDVIVVLNRDARVTYVSPAIEQILGQPVEEAMGGSAFTDIHPDDVEKVRALVAELIAERGSSRRFELRLRNARTDEWRWVDVIAANRLDDPVTGGIVATLRDVTDIKRAEDRFRDLVEHAPDALVIVDDGGVIRLVNRQVERLFGYDRGELLGEPVEVLVPEARRDRHEQHREGFVMDPRVREMGAGLDLLARRRDGSEFPVAISLSPLHTDEGVWVSAAIRDITEQRQAAAALQAAYEREKEAADRLREVDQLKDEFLATVSHELRTPLTSIAGFARVLSLPEGVDDEQSRVLLERVVANADEMVGMVEQLLDYSRLQAGKATVDPRPADVAGMVRASLAPLADRLSDHEVVLDLPAGLAAVADEDAVNHVLRNLLTNAAKFAPAGTAITVAAEPHGDEVHVRVIDEGPGVPLDEQDAIFERFHQVPGTPTGVRGTGLGLSIARRYTELQGGRIWVESEPGHGSMFVFTLPLALPREGAS